MSELHLDILDPERKKVLKKLTEFSMLGYLAGGTALALQIGHRKSFDFDVFSPQPLPRYLLKKIITIFGESSVARVDNTDFLLVHTPQQIELNFVHYWFKLLNDQVHTQTISLASIQDIASDKAHTIGRRAAWRDYIDMFWLLKHKEIDLPTVVKLAKKKFNGEFSETLFLKQLVYFDDIEMTPISWISTSYTEKEIKLFLQDTVRTYTKKLLGQS